MDMQMPEMDGLEATRALLALPNWEKIPIIAMTANALPADRQRCREAGMIDFVAKPIEPEQLFKTLQRWARPDAPPVTLAPTAPVAPDILTKVPATNSSPLPERIEGLDLQAGLRRVMGKSDLYLRLLHDFVATQADAPARIAIALAANDRATAERIAHTLKGVAGTWKSRGPCRQGSSP